MINVLVAFSAPAVWNILSGKWRPKWWDKVLGGGKWRPLVEYIVIISAVLLVLAQRPLSDVVQVIESASGQDAQFLIGGVVAVILLVRANRALNVDDVSRTQNKVESAVDRFGDKPFFTSKQVADILGTDFLPRASPPPPVDVSEFASSAGGSVGNAVTSVFKSVGSLFSDVRLKNNLTQVGQYKNGVAVYEWEWTQEALNLGAEPERTRGVLAQEVLRVDPQSVTVGPEGFLMVDKNYFEP